MVTIQARQTEAGTARRLRLTGRSSEGSLLAVAGQDPSGREWVRWSATREDALGRWILGSTRGWNGARGAGWGDPLATRGGRAPPAPALTPGPAGVTWSGGGAGESWTVGLGRDREGRAAGALLMERSAWTAGWEMAGGIPRAVAAWAPDAPALVPRGELAVGHGLGEARVGLGGGHVPAGLIVETVAERGRSTDWRGEVGMRTAGLAGLARFRGRLERADGVVRSGVSTQWERSGPGGSVRITWRSHPERTEVAVVSTPSGHARLSVRVDVGGPRALRRLTWSASGSAAGMRYGLGLETPARSPRRGSVWWSRGGRDSAVRVAADWRRGRKAALTLTWSGRLPAGAN